MDSPAAIGICKRTGVENVRHLDTRLLWIQDLVRDGRVSVLKVSGVENPTDLMTKHLGADSISTHLVRLSCWEREGRADLAPRIAGPMRTGPSQVGEGGGRTTIGEAWQA